MTNNATSWREFLEAAGARWDRPDTASAGTASTPGGVHDFGDLDAERASALSADVLVDLGHFGLLSASGGDALDFLQGQLSNDLREVTPERSQLAAWCSAKGRVLAVMRIFRRDNKLHLLFPRALLESTASRLRLFVLRADVTFQERTDLVVLGVSGRRAAQALGRVVGCELPTSADAAATRTSYTLLRVAGEAPRVVVICPLAEASALWHALSETARPAGTHAWTLLDLRSGIPTVQPATADRYLPQMLNLQRINGVSFTKGCYVGQEIVARTEHLGRVKRQLYRLRGHAAVLPAPGDPVLSGAQDTDRRVGDILELERLAGDGFEALAVLDIEVAAGMPVLVLDDPQKTTLELAPLPYPLD